jgi:hypothetical protein
MNLKEKLYILKNHTFLLLGPSSFELWFESYLSITVESLYFLHFATGPPFFYLFPPLLCFSTAHRRRSCKPCAPPPRRPEPFHVSFPASLLPFPTLRCPPPLSPRRTAEAERPPRMPGGHAGTACQSEPGCTTALPPLHFHRVLRPYKAGPSSSFLLFPLSSSPRPPKPTASGSPDFFAATPPRPNSSHPVLPHLLH